MDRREALKLIAASLGCALARKAAAMVDAVAEPRVFGASDVALFDEVAETLLPRTDTPGAKDAHVGLFMATFAEACYAPPELAVLRAGVRDLDDRMKAAAGIAFAEAGTVQREAVLNAVVLSAKGYDQAKTTAEPPHYFTLMRDLALLGFFTSEIGATKVSRYNPVPGPFHGCVPYRGEPFWSWA